LFLSSGVTSTYLVGYLYVTQVF